MIKPSTKFSGNILIELKIKSYTLDFLKVFLLFFKQRFFKNFVKIGQNKLIINKYTLLRSSFVNKSSREQIEKRIFKKKMHLLFSELDFQSFYSNLSSLNFKGISIKLEKHFFLENTKHIDIKHNNLNLVKKFKLLWLFLNKKKQFTLVNKVHKNNLHKVFTLIGSKKPLSKHVSLKFLKSKSKFKNRFKEGLFKTLSKKNKLEKNYLLKNNFDNFRTGKKNYCWLNQYNFLNFVPNVLNLNYSYNFNQIGHQTKNFKRRDLSMFDNKQKSNLLRNNSCLNSILRYRTFFLWPSFVKKRKDYKKSLSTIFFIDKLSIFSRLILGLKLNMFKPVVLNQKLRSDFVENKNKHFSLFLQKFEKSSISILKKIYYKKQLDIYGQLNKTNLETMVHVYNKTKSSSGQVGINPWLIRRSFFRNKEKDFRSVLKSYLSNKVVFSVTESLYFLKKPIIFFLITYLSLISTSTNSKKTFHLKKRFLFLLKRTWGIVFRIRSKKKFFVKKTSKKNSWKKFNRKNLKIKKFKRKNLNLSSFKRKTFKKLQKNVRYTKNKKKKLNLFSV